MSKGFQTRTATRRSVLAGIAIGGLFGLSGCGSIGGFLSPTDTYDLTAPTGVKVGGGTGAQILVPDPQALHVLDTERVMVRDGIEVRYLSGAQWTDRLPRLVQARMIQTFENSGRVRAVGKPGQGLAIDYQVVTDIRRFEYQAREKRSSVEISVKLMNDRDGRVLATQIFRAEVPVAGEVSSTIIAALDEALDRVLISTMKWVFGRI